MKDKMGLNTNRAVREKLSEELADDLPKYMALLANYERELEKYSLELEYRNLLKCLIKE